MRSITTTVSCIPCQENTCIACCRKIFKQGVSFGVFFNVFTHNDEAIVYDADACVLTHSEAYLVKLTMNRIHSCSERVRNRLALRTVPVRAKPACQDYYRAEIYEILVLRNASTDTRLRTCGDTEHDGNVYNYKEQCIPSI